jgi:hypothetical protein
LAWPEYLKFGMYVCQPERSFRDVPYMGFYTGKEIKPKVAKRLAWWPAVTFDAATAGEWAQDDDHAKRRVGEAIPKVLEQTDRNVGSQYGVMLLSGPEDVETIDVGPVPHHAKGAWTQQQRYTSKALLEQGPVDTDELARWELEQGLR